MHIIYTYKKYDNMLRSRMYAPVQMWNSNSNLMDGENYSVSSLLCEEIKAPRDLQHVT